MSLIVNTVGLRTPLMASGSMQGPPPISKSGFIDAFMRDSQPSSFLARAHTSHVKLLPTLLVTLSAACTESEEKQFDSLDLNSLIIVGGIFFAAMGLSSWLFSRRNKRSSIDPPLPANLELSAPIERSTPETVVSQEEVSTAEVKAPQLSREAIRAELASSDTELFHRIQIRWRSGYGNVFSEQYRTALHDSFGTIVTDSQYDYVERFKIEKNVDVRVSYHRDAQLMLLYLRVPTLTSRTEGTDSRKTEFNHQIAWPSSGGVVDQEVVKRIIRSMYGENIFDAVDQVYQQAAQLELAEGRHLLDRIIEQASKESLIAALSSIH